MPKYKVNVCRTSYSNLTIEVEADSEEKAERLAEQKACDMIFPLPHTSQYDAQGAVIVG